MQFIGKDNTTRLIRIVSLYRESIPFLIRLQKIKKENENYKVGNDTKIKLVIAHICSIVKKAY